MEKVDDPVARIERLLAGSDRALREAFINTITRIRDTATIARLEPLIAAGRIEEAIAIGTEAYAAFAAEWIEVYIRAAKDTAGFIGRELGIIVVFDQTNSSAVSAMQANRLRLVRELSQSQTDAVRAALIEGIESGAGPRAQARAFRGAIGLTANQQRMVENFRRELEEGSSRVFGRKLRDRRFDRTIRRAIARGEILDAVTINRMVTRYRERWVKFRSEVIGRTEALRSVHEGVEATYQQEVEAGNLDRDTLVRIWNTALDERVRDFDSSSTSHRTMHGQERRFGEPFTSGAGNLLDHPGDPSAPAIDTIQCRCVLSTRFQDPPDEP